MAPSSVLGTLSMVKSTPSFNPSRSCRRAVATRLMAWMAMSLPIRRRFKLCAASKVVAHPQNGSNTTSPSFDLALMILSSNAKGFCVG
ncbi:MAG: hypothetical protein M2R46_04746 [Verrucomicrobia subdivision 3 bacterium]|nr:hypothetical protein [Limisphaerales bacterium]